MVRRTHYVDWSHRIYKVIDMQAYKTYVTVEPSRQIVLKDLPFAPGSQVEIVVIEAAPESEQILQQWQESNTRIRALAIVENITEEEIQAEIDACRSTGCRSL
jgi:hypothetical protein